PCCGDENEQEHDGDGGPPPSPRGPTVRALLPQEHDERATQAGDDPRGATVVGAAVRVREREGTERRPARYCRDDREPPPSDAPLEHDTEHHEAQQVECVV